jgi:hypothetical protein
VLAPPAAPRATQYGVPHAAAALQQPACWQRCRLHSRRSIACRLERPWSSPRVGTACLLHARCRPLCYLDAPWSNPPHTAAPVGAAETLLLCCAIHSRHQPSLIPQRAASAHRTPYTRRWQCESRSDVGFSMSPSRWSRALGRGTYGGCVVGEDGQGLLRTLHRQVRRLLARRRAASQTLGWPVRAPRTPHRCPASTARRKDRLGVHLAWCSEGGLRCTCSG